MDKPLEGTGVGSDVSKLYTTVVDSEHELAYSDSTMARATDVLTQMADTLLTDAKRLGELAAQRSEIVSGCSLAEAHNRYVANLRETRATEESSLALQAFIGPERYQELM